MKCGYASVEIRHQNRQMNNASEFLKIKLKTWDVLVEIKIKKKSQD
jgi:hypothetical protein